MSHNNKNLNMKIGRLLDFFGFLLCDIRAELPGPRKLYLIFYVNFLLTIGLGPAALVTTFSSPLGPPSLVFDRHAIPRLDGGKIAWEATAGRGEPERYQISCWLSGRCLLPISYFYKNDIQILFCRRQPLEGGTCSVGLSPVFLSLVPPAPIEFA
jgi:hypothetical protein